MKRWFVLGLVMAVCSGPCASDDRRWENPVIETAEQAAVEARVLAAELGPEGPLAARLFVEAAIEGPGSARSVVEQVLLTHPSSMLADPVQRQTIERFTGEIPSQSRTILRRLGRFGFPELDGLVFCRLVDSVDAFSNLGRGSSDRMSRVGGVTYYCRYVVLPLSYVGADNIRDLKKSAALNPGTDVGDTLRRWQRESYASLVSTFRHELVHVYANSSIGLPKYSDRALYPTWFHEGTATYLAGDPHSGLSSRYKVYQKTFFYLVQRFGVGRLGDFFRTILGGSDVAKALEKVYEIDESQVLFDRSERWHRNKRLFHTSLWVAALALLALAFRGENVPVIGGLMLLVALALVFSIATGLPQHLAGLSGPTAIVIVQVALAGSALAIGWRGLRRIHRHFVRRPS